MEFSKVKYSMLVLLISISICLKVQVQELFAQTAQNKGKNLLQIRETGLPFITQYTIDDYHAFYQNWAVTQDSNGIIYFGNGDGVLVYDGTNWELITLPNQSTVFSLTKDKNDRIYVGAVGEIGYLEADSSGRLRYISLVPFLKENDRNFTRINSAYASSEGIYFQSPEALFRWSGKNFQVWKAGENKFTRAFLVNNILFLKAGNDGLLQLKNNELKPLPNSRYFSDKYVSTILPYDRQQLLIGTQDNGLFLYDGQNLLPFITENDLFLKNNKIYCGVLLNDSSFALGTLQGGLVVIDKSGRQRFTLNNISKLTSPTIFNLFIDKSGILWAVLNDGIAKIEYPSPFSIFDSDAQLKSTVYLITRYQGKIYAGTDRGLFYMNISPPETSIKFRYSSR